MSWNFFVQDSEHITSTTQKNGIIGIIGIHDLSATSDPRAHPAPGLRSPRLTRPLQQFRRLRRDAIFLHQALKLKVVE
jgi:hypothetical protein